MAKANSTAQILLLFFLVFSLTFISLQARIFQDHQHIRRKIDSNSLLHELGFDLSKLEKYSTRRSLSDRVSPGGPNSQHH
ncbi:CLAVATA3/ESR (CLE)-related protein 5-like [Ziziphus jujuba]|uniref:CLAVATA3/ESR (CLE)-related protein 5-like n=1 Tax=Ziziphus jujuba TaxID=326968 RepID=A0A6P4A632_ZIZJJ|nr:CLAVATA3/ESR (CLE)-related protein 5-like [Ziziphus jujuba]